MLIIDENRIKGINYDPSHTKIVLSNDNNIYTLLINDEAYASSDSKLVMDILYSRVIFYCERYRRNYDTFDIQRELKIIHKEIDSGKFNDLKLDPSTVSKDIGYPTYTS